MQMEWLVRELQQLIRPERPRVVWVQASALQNNDLKRENIDWVDNGVGSYCVRVELPALDESSETLAEIALLQEMLPGSIARVYPPNGVVSISAKADLKVDAQWQPDLTFRGLCFTGDQAIIRAGGRAWADVFDSIRTNIATARSTLNLMEQKVDRMASALDNKPF